MGFYNWFIGEPGAAWIIGFLGIALSLFFWLKRGRPAKIIIQEITRTKILGIRSSHKANIDVFYTSKDKSAIPIHGLIQRKFIVYNSGTNDILEPIEIMLGFTEDDAPATVQSLWEFSTDSPDCTITPLYDAQDGHGVGARLRISFLNSFAEHKHFVCIYLVSEDDLEFEITGGIGKGWSTYYISRDGSCESVEQSTNFTRLMLWIVGYVFILLAIALGVLAIKQGFATTEGSPNLMLYIRPTPEKITAYLEHEREKLTFIMNEGLWESLKRFFQSSSWVLTLIFALIFAVIGGTIKSPEGTTLSIVNRLRGIQPKSAFDKY